MTDPLFERRMISGFMADLVSEAGGVDAAAALIGARLGREVSKGTISKRLSGQAEWPLTEILALERAVGKPSVSRWLAGGVPEVAAARDVAAAVGTAMREHGEAMGAALALLSGGDRAAALRELSEAGVALAALVATVADGVFGGGGA